MKNNPRKSMLSILFDILIDLALIGMGAALYIHFKVYSFGPVDLSPVVVRLFGSRDLAVLVISGIPAVVGVYNLLRTIVSPLKNIHLPGRTLKNV
jgi:hypothetical protein